MMSTTSRIAFILHEPKSLETAIVRNWAGATEMIGYLRSSRRYFGVSQGCPPSTPSEPLQRAWSYQRPLPAVSPRCRTATW